MVRRRIVAEPKSRLAIWAQRVALFSLVATLVAIVIVRSGALEIVPALSTLAGALVLAAVAILLALGAAMVIWFEGVRGAREAATALLIGCALIGYPFFLFIRAHNLPAIYDVTTDPIDPPQFDAIARLRPRDANPIAYAGLYAAEQQQAAYSDIEPDDTDSSPQDAYNAAMKVIVKRKWRVVDARPPLAAVPRLIDARASQAPATRDGIIEAVARTPILGFRDDLVVRVRATSDGARIDVRSASRYGRRDFGTNATRVRNLINDIDTALAAPAPQREPEPERKQTPGGKTGQPAARGASAKR
jgi:Protein of unknown function (DUF1499)